MKKTAKKLLSLLLVLCLAAGLVLPAQAARERAEDFSGFKDVPEEPWYRNYLDAAVKTKLFYGTSEETFEPDRPITRAEAVTVLGRVAFESGREYIPKTVVSKPFTDVPMGQFYTMYVQWVKTKNIALGEYGMFYPERSVTQEELAVMISRMLMPYGYPEPEIEPDSPDYERVMQEYEERQKKAEEMFPGIAEWAKPAMMTLVEFDVFNGWWSPQKVVTRAESAVFFTRLYERIVFGTNAPTDFDRKYRYTVTLEEGQEEFHLLEKKAANGVYYQYLETVDEYYALMQEVGGKLTFVKDSEYGFDPEKTYTEGAPGFGSQPEAKLIAIEMQRAASPDYDIEYTGFWFVTDDWGSGIHIMEKNLGGGEADEITGCLVLMIIPARNTMINVFNQVWTGEYRGVGLDEGYPAKREYDLGYVPTEEEQEQEKEEEQEQVQEGSASAEQEE